MKTIASLILSLGFMLLPGWSLAQFNETKTVNKAGLFRQDGVLSIENKYGNITVRSWKKDSIRIKAVIKISSKSRDRLAMLSKRSQVSVYLSSDFADVKTVVDESTLAKEWRNLKSIASAGGDQIKVVYYVNVPEKAKLEVLNRFGNTYINNHKGRVSLDSEHGDVRLGTVENLESVEASFGKVYARQIGRSDFDLAFCDLDVGKARSMRIESKSSTIHVGEVQSFRIKSSRDKITLKKVGTVDLTGTLTKLEIEELDRSIDVSMRYGKLWVRAVQSSFTDLRIKPKHSSIYLNFESNDRVKTVIKGEDIAIDYDKGMGELKKNGTQYEGYIGSVPSQGKSMYISGEKSSFVIDFRNN